MRLWPNLGGEEGRPSPALKPAHPLRAIARAWSLLFGPGAVLLAKEGCPDEPRAWPAALGEEPSRPCWAWLETDASATAWWPDAEARRELDSRGLAIEAPAPDVLHAVHDKAFTLERARRSGALGGGLEDLVRALAPEELEDESAVLSAVERWPEWASRHWVLKPRFGSTGRGRVHSTELEEGNLARALPRLRRRGGAILEPWLDRVRDHSVQLIVHDDGRVESLGSLHQLVKPGGAVLGGAAELDREGRSRGAGERHEPLVEEALALGREAAARGFRGPCGVDSFAWRGPDGAVHLRRLCELNARFTTGHVAIGCALRARDAGLLGPAGSWRFLLRGDDGACALQPEGAPPLSLHG